MASNIKVSSSHVQPLHSRYTVIHEITRSIDLYYDVRYLYYDEWECDSKITIELDHENNITTELVLESRITTELEFNGVI